ncbi:uncharacterized protein LOC119085193 isoform X2 [Bradysia coprophila]|uniref:uncharacterized protein LOC119085193 isoform X2 n=1 Tax=Bradysia coprophila TaxID=38358 RepID=UPI00187DB5AA|nr:uncharacterized protein LOC119085193 isoform X2 [Bradysia coprophila]
MGLGQSAPSESEERNVGNAKSASVEKPMQPNSPKRVGKHINVIDSEILTADPHHEIVLKFQKLQMDNIIEERNHSERIIREKEKLLKEKEETIRQQANLIKTQNELLGQRKQRRAMPNVGAVKSHQDVGYKPRSSKPLAKHAPLSKSVTSIENIHSNGQDYRNEVANDDFETKYYDVEPYPSLRQEQTGQTFSATNTPINNFPYSNPFQREACSSTVYYALNNVRPSNGLLSAATSSQQARRSQKNDYRRINSKNDDFSDYNSKQSADQLLADLEKQTNYEVQKLDNTQNGKRSLKPVTRGQCNFKTSVCRVARKNKTALIGAPQKCKKCDGCLGNVKIATEEL